MQVRQEWKGQASISNGFMKVGGAQVGQYAVLGDDLAGKTVMIVGYGSIGAAIGGRLRPFEGEEIPRGGGEGGAGAEVFPSGWCGGVVAEGGVGGGTVVVA